MRVIKVKDYKELSIKAANILASQIILKPSSVLGLATGSTPEGTYKELVRLYQEGHISFADVVTFNLDEYYGLDASNPESYAYYMRKRLFDHIDIKKSHTHIPNGKAKDVFKECVAYEEAIKALGGIDLQLLGIGRNGHIGFNEPDIEFEALTHLVDLDEDTIKANGRFFDDENEVPKQAISMGIRTIMHSKKILLLASGKDKADVIYHMLKGKITPVLPASVLQLHPDVTIIMDREAGSLLERKTFTALEAAVCDTINV